jgi:hypothetical protein
MRNVEKAQRLQYSRARRQKPLRNHKLLEEPGLGEDGPRHAERRKDKGVNHAMVSVEAPYSVTVTITPVTAKLDYG